MKDCSNLFFKEDPLKNKPWHRMAINSSPPDIQPNELIFRSSFMFFASVNAFVSAPIVAMAVYAIQGDSDDSGHDEYYYTGNNYAALNPFSYFIIMAPLLMFYTNEEGHYKKIVTIHQILIFILPILLHYQCGGLLRSGAIFLGSVLCPLGAAFFTTKRDAMRWFVIYIVAFFGVFFFEYNYYTTSNPSYASRRSSITTINGNGNDNGSGYNGDELVLSPQECVFFFMNFGGVIFITFSVALMFRTKLDCEYKKSERLIDNVLPRSIAMRLKEGDSHIIKNYDEVTILFADLVGFTNAAAVSPPKFLIGTFLRDVFSAWDQLLIFRNIDKIKTIGDAFMAVGGIAENQGRASREGERDASPNENSGRYSDGRNGCDYNSDEDNSHERSSKEVTVEMVLLALEMQQALDRINKRYNVSFKCRIGIHSGPVIAGVIGVKKFSFDVWGDAVNTASRMESHGIPSYLQLSSRAYKDVKDKLFSLGIDVRCRGKIEVKGKGRMKTYLIQMSEANEGHAGADSGAPTSNTDGSTSRRRRISIVRVPPAGDISSAEK